MKSFGFKISHRGLAQSIVTRLQSTTSASTSSAPEIQIPVRKERGPTDILVALERTIKKDPTAPKYKYHDDPYLIPFSNYQKRAYALAQESGRKTAMWIRQEHADLFQHRVAEPVIEAYLPKAVYTDKDHVSEETLKNVIKDGHKTDALTIYQLLEENVSDETKQALLELLCYYNDVEKFPNELLEEKWFRRSEKGEAWKATPEINKLFDELTKKDEATAAKAYNAMICGLAKHMNADKAWNLFIEAEQKGYPISLSTFNRVIGILSFIKDSTRERRAILTEVFQKMKAAGVQPNVGTLNSALKVALAVPKHEIAMEFCRDIFTEFKAAGVKPSLGSYDQALKIFYKKAEAGTPPTTLLRDIIAEINTNNEELTIQDPTDVWFFKTAMDVAANSLEDPFLADAIHQLLLTDKNYKFIGDGYKESLYYRYYLQLQVKNNTLEEFMKSYYDLLVPHLYTPEPSVMSEILKAISVNDPESGVQILPRIWSHLVQFNYLERRDLVSKALSLMRTHCVPPKDSPVHKMYADAAWAVWDFVTTQKTKRMQQINWTGPILGDVGVLCVRGKEYEKWINVITFMHKEQNSIIGPPSAEHINELFEACLFNGFSQPAMDLLHYCSDIGWEDVPAMAHKIHVNLPLLNHQLSRLKSLVNPEILNVPPKSAEVSAK